MNASIVVSIAVAFIVAVTVGHAAQSLFTEVSSELHIVATR